MRVIDTIIVRKSCRNYRKGDIEPELLEKLRSVAETPSLPLFGSTCRFHLVHHGEMNPGELKQLTTYGVIRGARYFIVGTVMPGPKAMEDFGYMLEAIILKATALGLGTCILGGTFKRSGFAAKVGLGEGELLPAITPVGYPADRKTFVDRMFRTVAGSDQRKPWEDLFFSESPSVSLGKDEAGAYERALECVRLAPSASNKQPWRIIREADRGSFHFYLSRTAGYGRLIKDIDLQRIDMGIAFCHFGQSTEELGLAGRWVVEEPTMGIKGLEYIASWVPSQAGHFAGVGNGRSDFFK